MNKSGSFTISLDFELFWGVQANRELEAYSKNLLGVYDVVPKMLELFNKYEIHVTWATVGFLFFDNIEEIKKNYPNILPHYKNEKVDPYVYLNSLDDKRNDVRFTKMHASFSLLSLIKNSKNQEIATHTYSHFFTYESYKNREAFIEDIYQAIRIGKEKNMEVSSLVFPRNQVEEKSVEVLKHSTIKSYRGNPNHWAYCDGDKPSKSFFLRLYRLFDTYVDISGSHTSLPCYKEELTELKASMMLRPYFKKLKFLESLKLRRIKKAMKHAAKEGENFHLWWHPHNFGVNQENNLQNLEELLDYFQRLKEEYKMKSLTMEEVVEYVKTK